MGAGMYASRHVDSEIEKKPRESGPKHRTSDSSALGQIRLLQAESLNCSPLPLQCGTRGSAIGRTVEESSGAYTATDGVADIIDGRCNLVAAAVAG